MYPLIRSGVDDVTMVRWFKKSELRPGSIVFFACEKVPLGYVLHRIIKRDGDKILTMGDGNLDCDGWTDINSVIGRVVKISRGRFSFNPNNKAGKLYFVLWKRLLPVRRQIIWGIHFCGRIRHGIKGRQR